MGEFVELTSVFLGFSIQTIQTKLKLWIKKVQRSQVNPNRIQCARTVRTMHLSFLFWHFDDSFSILIHTLNSIEAIINLRKTSNMVLF